MRTLIRVLASIGAVVLILALPTSTVLADEADEPVDLHRRNGGDHGQDGRDHDRDKDHDHDGDHGHYPPSNTVPPDHGGKDDHGGRGDRGGRGQHRGSSRPDRGNVRDNSVPPDTDVLGEVAVAGDGAAVVAQDAQDDDVTLAITGRTVGGTVGLAGLAIVVGGVLVVISRRQGAPT